MLIDEEENTLLVQLDACYTGEASNILWIVKQKMRRHKQASIFNINRYYCTA